MKNYFFVIFSAGVVISVVFGGRQTIPLTIEGINSAKNLNYLSISFAFALGQLINGAVTPFAGAIADKYGSGRTLVLGIILSALGTLLIPFSKDGLSLAISVGILSAGGSGIAGIPVVMASVNRLVPTEKSGIAFGFINAGGSIGQFLFAPLAGLIIVTYGWEYSLYISTLLLLLTLPFCFILKTTQTSQKVRIDSKYNSLYFTLSVALQTPSYIYLVVGFFVCGFHVSFIITHMPGVIALCGLPPTVSGYSFAVIGFFNILGSLFAGWYISKKSMKIFLSLVYISRALIVLLFLLSSKNSLSILLFSAALGFTYLSTVPPTAALVSKMFGPNFMATLFGLALFSHQVGGFLGAYLGGYFFTISGNYNTVWLMDIFLAIFAALIHLPIKEKFVNPITT